MLSTWQTRIFQVSLISYLKVLFHIPVISVIIVSFCFCFRCHGCRYNKTVSNIDFHFADGYLRWRDRFHAEDYTFILNK